MNKTAVGHKGIRFVLHYYPWLHHAHFSGSRLLFSQRTTNGVPTWSVEKCFSWQLLPFADIYMPIALHLISFYCRSHKFFTTCNDRCGMF